MRPWAILSAATVALSGCAAFRHCPVRSGEQATLYPTYAYQTEENRLVVPLRGRIIRPDEPSSARQVTTAILEEILRFAGKEGSVELLRERLSYFLAAGLEGRRISARVGGVPAKSEPAKTSAQGLFLYEGSIDSERVSQDRPGWASVRFDECQEAAAGRVQILEDQGTSVVVAVEDALRESGAGDPTELFANTFLKPFAPVKGMSQLLGRWEEQGARFHYVSNLPWQLYPELSHFFDEEAIPEGSMLMADWERPAAEGALAIVQQVLALLRSARGGKEEEISALMKRFPKRRFALVGSAAGKDPELFGSLARRFPGRVALIAVRDSSKARASGRYQAAFDRLPDDSWIVFRESVELTGRLPK